MTLYELKNMCGKVLHSVKAESLKAAVEDAVKLGVSLANVALREANLRWADLRDAYLRGADLRGADLGWADLGGADLRDADLGGADLRDADLRGADLGGADLRGADLRGADLGWADLRGGKVAGCFFPAPTMVLLASWRDVSDNLCMDLMRYDADNHDQSALFIAWADLGGACPYEGQFYQRVAHFTERRSLITSDFLSRPVKSARELMKALLVEKCVGAN